jgi:hypothetical protein
MRFLDAFDVTTTALGVVLFERTLDSVAHGLAPGAFITATATDAAGSTSEFSACREVVRDLRTTLVSAAAPGATVLEVASSEGLVGRVIEIGEGATAERNYGVATGSLVLAKKLRFAHAAGEPVVPVDDTLFVSVDRAAIKRSARPAGRRFRRHAAGRGRAQHRVRR